MPSIVNFFATADDIITFAAKNQSETTVCACVIYVSKNIRTSCTKEFRYRNLRYLRILRKLSLLTNGFVKRKLRILRLFLRNS